MKTNQSRLDAPLLDPNRQPRQLVIRADANSRIGHGHVMRTLALAQHWMKSGGTVSYVSDVEGALHQRLKNEGCRIQPPCGEPGSAQDANSLKSFCNVGSCSALVIDGYQFNERFVSSLRDESYTTLVFDDHVHLKKYNCDLLLNQNLGAKPNLYEGRTDRTVCLTGVEFALLRSEFLACPLVPIQDREFGRQPTRILVTLGGADSANVTQRIVEALSMMDDDIECRIILGSSNAHYQQVVDRVRFDSRFVVLTGIEDMSEQYRWADIAICAGGSSNWEMSYFGLPRALVVLAENQVAIADELAKQGVVLNLGWFENLEIDEVVKAIHTLIQPDSQQRLAERSAALVDGRGAGRVCVMLNEIATARAFAKLEAP